MSLTSGTADSRFPSDSPEADSRLFSGPTGRALLALGMGGFAIGTGEFVIMGLLPDAAADLGTSIPQAGYLISIYALGVVIGAPVLTPRNVPESMKTRSVSSFWRLPRP